MLNKPWNTLTDLPPDLYAPKGMLGDEERRMLFWAASRDFSGAGEIIDAGSFLGASAFALASGLEHAKAMTTSAPRLVHSYDYFEVVDDYVGEFISREFRPAPMNSPYFDLFEQQLGALTARVRTYPGDFLGHIWNHRPVELLFIDISKTLELNSHVIAQFFPWLIAGRSLVVQQDFYHAWHPYIHVTMQALKPYFEIVDGLVIHQSRVYRSTAPIPRSEIDRAARYDYPPELCYSLLSDLAEESVTPVREMARVLRLRHIAMDGNAALFAREWDAFSSTHDLSVPELWAVDALRVHAHRPL